MTASERIEENDKRNDARRMARGAVADGLRRDAEAEEAGGKKEFEQNLREKVGDKRIDRIRLERELRNAATNGRVSSWLVNLQQRVAKEAEQPQTPRESPSIAVQPTERESKTFANQNDQPVSSSSRIDPLASTGTKRVWICDNGIPVEYEFLGNPVPAEE